MVINQVHKFEIIYFYNVYGPNQIENGEMATVIGIFENQYNNTQADQPDQIGNTNIASDLDDEIPF